MMYCHSNRKETKTAVGTKSWHCYVRKDRNDFGGT